MNPVWPTPSAGQLGPALEVPGDTPSHPRRWEPSPALAAQYCRTVSGRRPSSAPRNARSCHAAAAATSRARSEQTGVPRQSSEDGGVQIVHLADHDAATHRTVLGGGGVGPSPTEIELAARADVALEEPIDPVAPQTLEGGGEQKEAEVRVESTRAGGRLRSDRARRREHPLAGLERSPDRVDLVERRPRGEPARVLEAVPRRDARGRVVEQLRQRSIRGRRRAPWRAGPSRAPS